MTGECCICQNTFDDVDDLRPYGPGGKPICHDCAFSTPELGQEAQKRLDGLVEELLNSADRGIILGGGEPRLIGKPLPVV